MLSGCLAVVSRSRYV